MVEMDVGCRQISDLGSPVMRPAPLLPSPFARHLRARASARDSYSLRDFDSFQPSSKMKQPALFRRTVSFLVALMEITSKNYQGILEFKLSNHAGRLSPSDTDIISQSPKNDKGENSDYYTDKKKVDRLQQPYQRAFTPEEIQKIVTAYQSGKASYELGAEFNCSKTTIVKLLKQQGVPLRKSGRTRAKVDDKKVIRMYKEMHTIKEISKNLNVDTQVISRCLKENGVKLRSRWDYPEK